jgi:hypothetical protein
MSEYGTNDPAAGEVPAVEDGTVAQPAGSEGDPQDVGALAAHNAQLRADLQQQNEALEAAIKQSQAIGLQLAGLTDEDVRRAEHPEEFTPSTDELHERLSAVESGSTATA